MKRNAMWRAACGFALAGLVSVLPIAQVSGQEGDPSDAEVLAGLDATSRDVLANAAADFGGDELLTVRKLRFLTEARSVIEQAKVEFGSAYAGATIDREGESVRIGIATDVPEATPPGLVNSRVRVTFSRASLGATRFAELRDTLAVGLYNTGEQVAIDTDEVTGTLTAVIADDATGAERSAAQQYLQAAKAGGANEALITASRDKVAALRTSAPLTCTKPNCDVGQGGIVLDRVAATPGPGSCTSNVLAQQSNGQWWMMTAGHCNPPTGGCSGTQTSRTYYNNTTNLGAFNAACYETAVPLDMGGIMTNGSIQLGLSMHMTNSSRQYQMLGALTAAPNNGDRLCHVGRTYFSYIGNYACGNVTSTGVTTVGGHQRYRVAVAGCHGDSGAVVSSEVFYNGQFRYQATGILSSGDTTLPNWNGYGDCYGAIGITALATEFAVWNGWGWGLTYYPHPNWGI